MFYTPLPTPWRVGQDPGPRRRRHYQGSSGAKEFACERCQVDSRGCVSVTPVLDSPCPTWSVHLLSSWSRAVPHISNLPNFLKYINCWVTRNAYISDTKGMCEVLEQGLMSARSAKRAFTLLLGVPTSKMDLIMVHHYKHETSKRLYSPRRGWVCGYTRAYIPPAQVRNARTLTPLRRY